MDAADTEQEKASAAAPSLPSVFEPSAPEAAHDNLAAQEAVKIANKVDLKEDGAQKEHHRTQKFRDHVNIATLGLFWVIAACFGVAIVVLAFHLVGPTTWHFLDKDQINTLKTLLGAGLSSGLLANYANKKLAD